MKRRRSRIRRWLVAGLAAGALGIPAAAQARPLIDDTLGGSNSTDLLRITMASQHQLGVFPEDRAVIRGANPTGLGSVVGLGKTDDWFRDSSMSPEEYRALIIRSQALNQMYKPVGPTGAELRADRLRGEALNRIYADSRAPVVVPSDDFSWGDAGIGAASGFGLALLLAGALIGARRRRSGPVATA